MQNSEPRACFCFPRLCTISPRTQASHIRTHERSTHGRGFRYRPGSRSCAALASSRRLGPDQVRAERDHGQVRDASRRDLPWRSRLAVPLLTVSTGDRTDPRGTPRSTATGAAENGGWAGNTWHRRSCSSSCVHPRSAPSEPQRRSHCAAGQDSCELPRTPGRTVGKRVGGNPSRVRISYPPHPPNWANEGSHRMSVGPFVVLSALVVLVFVHKARFGGAPDGTGDLPGHLLEHGVRHVEIPRPHPRRGSRLPTHDLIDHTIRDA
ncbi:hypothetical protein ABH932_001034 [Streptacidiphilus sp. MAP5-52]